MYLATLHAQRDVHVAVGVYVTYSGRCFQAVYIKPVVHVGLSHGCRKELENNCISTLAVCVCVHMCVCALTMCVQWHVSMLAFGKALVREY